MSVVGSRAHYHSTLGDSVQYASKNLKQEGNTNSIHITLKCQSRYNKSTIRTTLNHQYKSSGLGAHSAALDKGLLVHGGANECADYKDYKNTETETNNIT